MKKFVIAAVLLVALAMVPGVMADTTDSDNLVISGTIPQQFELSINEQGASQVVLASIENFALPYSGTATAYADVYVETNCLKWEVTVAGTDGGKMCMPGAVGPVPLQCAMCVDACSLDDPLRPAFIDGNFVTTGYSQEACITQATSLNDCAGDYSITLTFAGGAI